MKFHFYDQGNYFTEFFPSYAFNSFFSLLWCNIFSTFDYTDDSFLAIIRNLIRGYYTVECPIMLSRYLCVNTSRM